MVEALRPGVFVSEGDASPQIAGVSTATAGMVGIAERGPVDKSLLITDFGKFVERYGSFFAGNYLATAARAYFNEGGTRLYVVRAIGAGNAKATLAIKDIEETNTTFTVDAQEPGAFANQLGITCLKVDVKTTATLADTGTTVALDSIQGIQLGDIMHIDDGTTDTKVTVTSIVVATKSIVFLPASTTAAALIAVGAVVRTCSNHRVSTTLAADLLTGVTSATLTSSANLKIGQRIYISDGTTEVDLLVTGINGKVIQFAAIAIGATILSGSMVVSQEFELKLLENAAVIETYNFLSMEDTNEPDFIENRLLGTGNESFRITLTDNDSATSDDTHHIPFPQSNTLLAAGANGSTPSDTEIVGSAVVGSEDGLNLLAIQEQLNFFAAPGLTGATVQGAGVDLAEAQGDRTFIVDTPLAADTVDEVVEYREVTLNKDTRHAALYFPWLKVDNPTGTGQIDMPPSGHVMGEWADIAILRGIQFAPANVTLRGVLDLTHNTTEGEHDLLNPKGINVIRAFRGEGIRIFGARTLQSAENGAHFVPVSRVVDFTKASLAVGLRSFVFRPITPDLLQEVRGVLDTFFTGMVAAGLLTPQSNPSQAFFVKVDEENNPQAEQDAGRLHIDVGINPPRPAEKILLTVSLYSGSVNIQEVAPTA